MRLYPAADVILMVIRLNVICPYSENRLIEVLIATANLFYYFVYIIMFFSVFSVTYKLY